MPKSKGRTKNGKRVSGKLKRMNLADRQRIYAAYTRKDEEYETYPLEQLYTLRDSKTLTGTYLHALLEVIKRKEQLKNKAEETQLSSPKI